MNLKECPFCLENEQRESRKEDADGQYVYSVYCEYCGAYGPWSHDRQHAIDEWNKRGREE